MRKTLILALLAATSTAEVLAQSDIGGVWSPLSGAAIP